MEVGVGEEIQISKKRKIMQENLACGEDVQLRHTELILCLLFMCFIYLNVYHFLAAFSLCVWMRLSTLLFFWMEGSYLMARLLLREYL